MVSSMTLILRLRVRNSNRCCKRNRRDNGSIADEGPDCVAGLKFGHAMPLSARSRTSYFRGHREH